VSAKNVYRYSRALYQQPAADEAIVIKRNRALAFLRTQQYDAALSDLGFSDFSSDTNEKALYRAAQALYPLGRFKECWEVLQQLCSLFPNNAPGKELLERAHCRFFEQETGYYNFALLQVEAEKLKPPQLDHATYIGPIEVRSAGSKGRGLFVTNAVKAGDLLLCEKAFSYAWVNEREEGGPKVTLLLTADTNRGFMGGQADLIRIIAQKLYCNPSVARTFTTLYHGDYKAAETSTVDGKPVVDT
jgi:tetratricopeptide (TPR) repeat protein